MNAPASLTDKNPSKQTKVSKNHSPVSILNLISNKQVSKILVSTFKIPKSVQTLSRINDIPIAACYRKVRVLEELGFLRCVESKLNQNGKRVKYFQCQIINAHFFLEKGKFRARIQLSSGIIDDYGSMQAPSDSHLRQN